MNGTLTDEAARILVGFHHANVETLDCAIAERWTLAPISAPAQASTQASSGTAEQLLAPAAPPFHALMLQASEESGEISVSIETEHGWCEVISARLAGEVFQTAEPHWIAELVQRQHELAAQVPAEASS